MNPDTPSERLEELSYEPALQKLIAANPATPHTILARLACHWDPVVRRAVAHNPNADLPLLQKLASEFPDEFLTNPQIPLLILTSPNFINQFTLHLWFYLARSEHIPSLWLDRFQQEKPRRRSAMEEDLVQILQQSYVRLAGEVTPGWEQQAEAAIGQYRQSKIRHQADGNTFGSPLLLQLCHLALPQIFAYDHFLQYKNECSLSMLLHGRIPGLTASHMASWDKKAPINDTLHREFQRLLASRIDASEEILIKLAQSEYPDVRRAVARNTATPTHLLQQLALDPDEKVRMYIATQPHLTPSIYHSLAQDERAPVRAAVARNEHVPQALLRSLATDRKPKVRMALASNPTLPPEIFPRLAHDKHWRVRAHLAANPHLPLPLLEHFASDPLVEIRRCVAANPTTSPALLERLYLEPDVQMHCNIAANPNASSTLLAQLEQSGSAPICEALASNTAAPESLLYRLALHYPAPSMSLLFLQTKLYHNTYVYKKLLQNPSAPLSALSPLLFAAYEPDINLIRPIMDYPSAERAELLLSYLAYYLCTKQHQIYYSVSYVHSQLSWFALRPPSPRLRQLLLDWPALPRPLLEAFARSPYWEERYLAIQHPAASSEMLTRLTHDGHRYVRAMARKRLYGG